MMSDDMATKRTETVPAETAAAGPATKPHRTASEILAELNDLPPEEIVKLNRMGAHFPLGVESGDVTKGRYGYRCSNCNQIALHFVGDVWVDPHTGERLDAPPTNVPCSQVAWVQNVESRDRNNPFCQHCGAQINISPHGGFSPRYFVLVERHELLMDKAFNRRSKNRERVTVTDEETGEEHEVLGPHDVRRRIARMGVDLQGTSQTFEGKQVAPSERMGGDDISHEDAQTAVRLAADQLGAAAGLIPPKR